MLKESIAVLAATTPPPKSPKVTNIAVSNARIVTLETQLEVAHHLPVFNGVRAAARIAHLENLLAQKNVIALPATVPVAASVPTLAPAPAVVASIAAAPSEPENLTTTLARFKAMSPEARLQFAQDNGALSHADFSALGTQAKMAFCRNGGQVMADARRSHCTAAASFGKS